MRTPVTRAPPPAHRGLPRAVAVVSVVAALLSVPGLPDRSLAVASLPIAGSAAASAGVGVLLIERAPTNPIGRLLLLAGGLTSASLATTAYSHLAVTVTAVPWPAASLSALLSQILYLAALIILLIGVPLVFPDGRLRSRRWRWVGVLAVAALVAETAPVLFSPITRPDRIENPLALPAAAPLLALLEQVALFAVAIAFVAAAASTAIRFRAAGSIERQQLKWFLAAAGSGAVGYPIASVLASTAVGTVGWTVANLWLVALPLAIGIAVLRYRLYEIDRIISRTIAWTILTAALGGAFAMLVVGLTVLLRPITGEDSLAVAASTLVVAALFQPMRTRTQGVVDRRFDRGRFDAEATAAEFAERLRGEVDLESIGRMAMVTVDEAVHPTAVGLWVRSSRG